MRRWITLNEPVVHMAQGYAWGDHAPGRTLMLGALPVAHHQLLGHGLAVRALRARGAAEVMITNNCTPVAPASDDDADLAAAAVYDSFHNRLFNDPVLLGDLSGVPGGRTTGWSGTATSTMIRTPLDALGINYYNPTRVGAAPDGADLPFELRPIDGVPTTAFGWPVVPDGLRELLVHLKSAYGEDLPRFTSPRTGARPRTGSAGRRIDDSPDRLPGGHLDAVHRAIGEGVDVRGLLRLVAARQLRVGGGLPASASGWSGSISRRQQRTPKASYRWLQDALAGRARR